MDVRDADDLGSGSVDRRVQDPAWTIDAQHCASAIDHLACLIQLHKGTRCDLVVQQTERVY